MLSEILGGYQSDSVASLEDSIENPSGVIHLHESQMDSEEEVKVEESDE